MANEKDIQEFIVNANKIVKEINKDIIGQKDILESTLITIIAGGNILLEGVPGIGKTRLVKTLAKVLNMPFSRIQFTPDLMPADVTGTETLVKDESGNTRLQFQPGPIFSNIILADEINRATPKTQSALLEAMQEHTVTVSGETMRLEEPFFVLATQNPIEQDGTYPLPEAQLDRFMMKLMVGSPSPEELKEIVKITQVTMEETANPVVSAEDILKMRNIAKEVLVADDVLNYTVKLITATQPDSSMASKTAVKFLRFGSSPRGAQALITCAKVRALLKGRLNISYDDIDALAYPVLRHRIKLNFEAITSKLSSDDIITEIIKEIK